MKKNLIHTTALAFFLVTSLNIIGCGNGFNATFGQILAQGGAGGKGGIQSAWALVDKAGIVSGGPYNQMQAITINQTTQIITISIPVPSNPLGAAQGPFSIPELPGATLTVDQNVTTGAWSIDLNVPLQLLVKG